MRMEPGPSQRRITVGTKEIITPKEGVDVSNDPVTMTIAGSSMQISAKTFKWTVGAGEELTKALRPHIADKLKGLPSHHFAAIKATIGFADGEEVLEAIEITVVVPEDK